MPGLFRRLAAMFYDSLLLIAILALVTALILPINDGQAIEPGNWVYRGVLLAVIFLFFAFFWSRGGQTLGMRAWRLRLVNDQGQTPTFTQGLKRCCFALISGAALGLGYLWVLVDSKRLSWHDRWSNTHLELVPKGR